MKFTLERGAALDALTFLAGMVNAKAEVLILQNIKVEAIGQSVRLTGTDLDNFGVFTIPAAVEREGATTIEADRLYQIIRALPEGADFTVDLAEGMRASLRAGRSNFKLACLPAEDFSVMYSGVADTEGVMLPATLDRLLKVGGFCSNPNDKSRVYFQVTYLHTIGDKLRIASTDGKRASYCEVDAPAGFSVPKGVMLTAKTIALLRKMIANVSSDTEITVGCSESIITFATERMRLSGKTVGDEYVLYTRLMGGTPKGVLKVDTDMLMGCLRRMIIMASQDDHGVSFDLSDGTVKLAARIDVGEGAEELEALSWDGPDTHLNLNAAFLMEILAQVRTESVLLGMPGENICVSISETSDSDWRAVLAPFKG